MAEAAVEPEAPPAPEWRLDKSQRQYIPRRDGRSGIVYRQGSETIDEAHERDAKGPKKKPPKARARKPPAPTQVDLKELEYALAEMLRGPAIIAGMRGDEWGVQHFTHNSAQVARNLTVCAEHNPWLREKLIIAMAGEGPLMNVMIFAALGASIFAYAVPPIVYYLNPPVPERLERSVEMLRYKYRIPEPLEHDLAAPEAPASAEAPETAVV